MHCTPDRCRIRGVDKRVGRPLQLPPLRRSKQNFRSHCPRTISDVRLRGSIGGDRGLAPSQATSYVARTLLNRELDLPLLRRSPGVYRD